MQQFFVENKCSEKETCPLTEEVFHQLKNVLRYRGGEEVRLVDACGKLYLAEIHLEKKSAYAKILRQIHENKDINPPIYSAMARIKRDRWEWALQKLTELGVSALIPVRSLRVNEKDINDHQFKRQEKIIREAGEQAERSSLPKLFNEMSLPDLMNEFADLDKILLTERKAHIKSLSDISFKEKSSGILLISGPEGGFSDEEKEFMIKKGAREAGLGPNILRAETAAIAAAAIAAARLSALES